jgi:Protein of unknown function (DUF2442)
MDTSQTTVSPLTALRCWVQGRRIYLEINARRSVSFPASKYAALVDASQTELEKIKLHPDGRSIAWESLDEEIEVEDVANNRFFHTPKTAVA